MVNRNTGTRDRGNIRDNNYAGNRRQQPVPNGIRLFFILPVCIVQKNIQWQEERRALCKGIIEWDSEPV